MKYAVISLAGSQYKVSEDQVLTISHIEDQPDSVITNTQVLMFANDSDIHVGTPFLSNATVELKVLKHFKGPKLNVFKYKPKARYRKTHGHRDQLTQLQVIKLNLK